MTKVLVTLKLEPREATIAKVRRAYGLAPGEIDADYGVVGVSPDEKLYVVMVEEEAAARMQGAAGMRGISSNPRIEPFGPPQS